MRFGPGERTRRNVEGEIGYYTRCHPLSLGVPVQKTAREFEGVVWGASGLTGKLVAESLLARYGVAGNLRWTIGEPLLARLDQNAGVTFRIEAWDPPRIGSRSRVACALSTEESCHDFHPPALPDRLSIPPHRTINGGWRRQARGSPSGPPDSP